MAITGAQVNTNTGQQMPNNNENAITPERARNALEYLTNALTATTEAGSLAIPAVGATTAVAINEWLKLIATSPIAFGGAADGTTDSTAAIEACLATYGACNLTPGTWLIKSTVHVTNGQVINFVGGKSSILEVWTGGFTGTQAIEIKNAVDSTTYCDDVAITGPRGYIKGNNVIDIGIGMYRPRGPYIDALFIEGFNESAIVAGTELSGSTGYEVSIAPGISIWYNGQNDVTKAHTNTPTSVGIWLKRVTDSDIWGANVSGYYTGLRSDGGSNRLNGHAWTRGTYQGPMQYGMYINASGCWYDSFYADTPTNIGPSGTVGSITACYGEYNNTFRNIGGNLKVFLNSDYGVDNLVYPVYSAVANSALRSGKASISSASSGIRFIAPAGGSLDNAEITGISDDARLVSQAKNLWAGRPNYFVQGVSGTPLGVAATAGSAARFDWSDWDGAFNFIVRFRAERDASGNLVWSCYNGSGTLIASFMTITGSTGSVAIPLGSLGVIAVSGADVGVNLGSGGSFRIYRETGLTNSGLIFQSDNAGVLTTRAIYRLNANDDMEQSFRTSAGAFDGAQTINSTAHTVEYTNSSGTLKASINYSNGITYQAPMTKAALLLITPTAGLKSPALSDATTQAYDSAFADGTNWRYTSAPATIVT